MLKTKNPATGERGRVLNIAAIAKPLDVQNLTETSFETQSESLAIRTVMRRAPVSYWHALTICRLSGLGGAA